MLEDRLDLERQLFLRQRYEGCRFRYRPLLPCAAIEPDFRTFGGCCILTVHFDDRGVDRFLAHAVRAMWIGKVAGDKNDFRLQFAQQIGDDAHVGGTDRILAHLACLIKRQVEKARVAARESHDFNAAYRFRLADDAFDVLHFGNVDLSSVFRLEKLVDELRELAYCAAVADALLIETFEEVHVSPHIVIEDGDISTRHVRDGDRVLVLDKLAQDAAHRDDIVVRVRRETDHALLAGQLALAANFCAKDVEDETIHRAR